MVGIGWCIWVMESKTCLKIGGGVILNHSLNFKVGMKVWLVIIG